MTVKSPSPVIMVADMIAVPALVPPYTTPSAWRDRTAASSAGSASASMTRAWSPPVKKTPVARARARRVTAAFSGSSGVALPFASSVA